jgi:CRISPR-associated protein Csm4
MKIVHLKPLSSYRTELRADTLWGLLMVAIKNVYTEEYLEKLLDEFNSNEPPFNISSAFHFYEPKNNGNTKRVYYLPKPYFKFNYDENPTGDVKSYRQELENLKKFKKAEFIPLETFESLINGEKSESDLFQEFSSEDEAVKIRKKEVITKKASIDRLTSTTREEGGKGQLFSMKEIFLENGGLYFLVEGETKILEPALRFLQHYGFGADSSNGKGHFLIEETVSEDSEKNVLKEFTIRQPEESDYLVNLGIYNPTEPEIKEIQKNEDKVFYSLAKRSGLIGVTFLGTGDVFKDSVVCFGEGSIFPDTINKNNYGRLNAVKEHQGKKIFHNGIGFMIKANFRMT